MKFKLNHLLTILILISFVCFPQKKFLFDNLHAETAGNADWVIDEDSNVPGRYPTPAQSTVTSSTAENYWTGALSSWGIALVKLGHSVETLTGTSTLTYGTANAQDLKNYDVFVVDEPNTLFTSAEKTALINFVQNGGGLFMISDHIGSDRNNDGYDSPMIWNDLFTNNGIVTNPFGMSVDLTNISQTSTNVATGDYLISGSAGTVTAMKWSNGATATLNTTANNTVTGVVWTTGTSHGTTGLMVARAKYGSGRVVLVCDSSPADDGTGGSGNTLYVGWLDPSVNGSHAALHMNGSLWLAKVLEELPVELVSFSAKNINNEIHLNWATATQLNNFGWNVERRLISGNEGWSIAGTVTGAGTNSVKTAYSFTDKVTLNGTFDYRLKQIDQDGNFTYSNTVSVTVDKPAAFTLENNYPNPFNPSTKINYSLPSDSKVTLEVYNITGVIIGQLVNEEQAAGYYSVGFNSSSLNKNLSSGVYFYRLTAIDRAGGNNFSSIKKMLLIK
jgi:hypothetical protein